jgi:hypothetical protein
MSPLARRIVFSWIATDIIWAALFIWVLKRERGWLSGLRSALIGHAQP